MIQPSLAKWTTLLLEVNPNPNPKLTQKVNLGLFRLMSFAVTGVAIDFFLYFRRRLCPPGGGDFCSPHHR